MAATTDLVVLERLAPVDGRAVVDVGCGSGDFARGLLGRAATVTGIEVSEAKVDAARAAGEGGGARFALGRGEALPLADGSADLVIYLRSFHHVPMPAMDEALREARRVLGDGGVLYVVEPLLEGDLHALVSLVEDETEVRTAAQAALARAGDVGYASIAVERYDTVARFRDLDGLRAQIVGVDPGRAPAFDARRDELQRRFDARGEADGGSRAFSSPQQVAVLAAD